jgi:hypothetical protein
VWAPNVVIVATFGAHRAAAPACVEIVPDTGSNSTLVLRV